MLGNRKFPLRHGEDFLLFDIFKTECMHWAQSEYSVNRGCPNLEMAWTEPKKTKTAVPIGFLVRFSIFLKSEQNGSHSIGSQNERNPRNAAPEGHLTVVSHFPRSHNLVCEWNTRSLGHDKQTCSLHGGHARYCSTFMLVAKSTSENPKTLFRKFLLFKQSNYFIARSIVATSLQQSSSRSGMREFPKLKIMKGMIASFKRTCLKATSAQAFFGTEIVV